MSPQKNEFYDFGEFRVDIMEQALSRDGTVIPVTPKVFETLLVFIENAGRIIEKEELMRQIWRDRFVEESNLTFNIGMLRKALGDDAANPTYIETLPRRGYRFVSKVSNSRPDWEPVIIESASNRSARAAASGASPLPVVSIADWRHQREGSIETNASPEPPHRALAEPARTPQSRPHLLWVFVCIALIAVAGASFAMYRYSAVRAGAHSSERLKANRLTSSGNAKSSALSPDGKFLAYVLDEPERNTLWLKNIAADSTIQIPLPSAAVNVSNFSFSPDGNFLYFGILGTLYQFPVLGGTPRKILDDFGGGASNAISFSPDGTEFSFLRATGSGKEEISIVISSSDGGSQRVLARSSRPGLFLRSAAWSPDGKKIACASLMADGSQHIAIANVEDGTVAPLSASRKWSRIDQIVWHPQGHSLLLLGDDLSEMTLQIFSVSYPEGIAKNITSDTQSYESLSISADGQTIVALRVEQEAHIWTASADDPTSARHITQGFEKLDGVSGLGWTGDGNIVYESEPGGKLSIHSVAPQGTGSKRLADEGGMMAVSPDGRFLVYQQTEDRSGNAAEAGLFRTDTVTGSRVRLTTGMDIYPAISPDGRYVAFTRFAEGVALWRIPIEGGEAKQLTDLTGIPQVPSFSPDGTHIVFHRMQNGQTNASLKTVVRSDGGGIVAEFAIPAGKTHSVPGRHSTQWTPDGKAFDYALIRDGVSNIVRQKLEGGAPTTLTNFTSGLIFNFAVSPDGRQIAYSRGSYARDVIAFSH